MTLALGLSFLLRFWIGFNMHQWLVSSTFCGLEPEQIQHFHRCERTLRDFDTSGLGSKPHLAAACLNGRLVPASQICSTKRQCQRNFLAGWVRAG